MRSQAFIAVGLGFVLMGAGLFALTLRRDPPPPAQPTKAWQRGEAARVAERRKMRLAAGVVAGAGAALVVALLF